MKSKRSVLWPILYLERSSFLLYFAQLARLTTIQVLPSFAALHVLLVHKMNAKMSFLNGDLDKESTCNI